MNGLIARARFEIAVRLARVAAKLFWIGGRINGAGRDVQALAERIDPRPKSTAADDPVVAEMRREGLL